nr:MAG TPA: hypothetical protein [Caudoviricetes sp.]
MLEVYWLHRLYLYYFQYHLINRSNSQFRELFHGIYLQYPLESFHLLRHT